MNPIFEKKMTGLRPITITTWKYQRRWDPFEKMKIERKGDNSLFIGDVSIPIGQNWIFYDAQYVLEKPLVIIMTYILPDKECESEKRYASVIVTYSMVDPSKNPKRYNSYKTEVRMAWVRPVIATDYNDRYRLVEESLKDDYPVYNKIADRIVSRFGIRGYLLAYFVDVTPEQIEIAYRPYLLGSFGKYVEI